MDFKDRDAIVLALPRGGVPVAWPIAGALNATLDVLLVRKLGAPDQEELAMGAIAEGGYRVVNDSIIRALNISPEALRDATSRELQELDRRAKAYRGSDPPVPVEGRIVILVDDGLATGATMKVAARAVRERNPAHTVIAVPVAPPETCESLQQEADEVVCELTPEVLRGVGSWYEDFTQVSDDEVRELLARARRKGGE